MKIAVISFTTAGRRVAERVAYLLCREGHIVKADVKGTVFPDSISASVSEWAGRNFGSQDALVFVGAAGIAVRAVAPYIRSKTEDAAVLVIDERGDYCIPVLSGHIGGANELALLIGRELPAVPVVTTATDIQRKWAADVFAVKNKLIIQNMEKAKQVSARLLAGERLLLFCDADEISCEKEYSSLEIRDKGDAGRRESVPDIYVGYDRKKASGKTLCLIPRVITAGIGCKKGTEERKIRLAVDETLKQAGIFREALKQAASIDLKREEQGLIEYCKGEGISFVTYSAEALLTAEGTFSSSEFVKRVTGVDNVCERSAVLACSGGLLVRKQMYEGVTIALAAEKWSVCFE